MAHALAEAGHLHLHGVAPVEPGVEDLGEEAAEPVDARPAQRLRGAGARGEVHLVQRLVLALVVDHSLEGRIRRAHEVEPEGGAPRKQRVEEVHGEVARDRAVAEPMLDVLGSRAFRAPLVERHRGDEARDGEAHPRREEDRHPGARHLVHRLASHLHRLLRLIDHALDHGGGNQLSDLVRVEVEVVLVGERQPHRPSGAHVGRHQLQGDRARVVLLVYRSANVSGLSGGRPAHAWMCVWSQSVRPGWSKPSCVVPGQSPKPVSRLLRVFASARAGRASASGHRGRARNSTPTSGRGREHGPGEGRPPAEPEEERVAGDRDRRQPDQAEEDHREPEPLRESATTRRRACAPSAFASIIRDRELEEAAVLAGAAGRGRARASAGRCRPRAPAAARSRRRSLRAGPSSDAAVTEAAIAPADVPPTLRKR